MHRFLVRAGKKQADLSVEPVLWPPDIKTMAPDQPRRFLPFLTIASDKLAGNSSVPCARDDRSIALPCLEGLRAKKVCWCRLAHAPSTQLYAPVAALEEVDRLGLPFSTIGIVLANRSAQTIGLLVKG